ncbi:MAG TPA: peptidylprolyl isomerase [Candidatus Baltobacteraceae bacterium]|nr:peptidylprolyl isomerase [Candidatus Baltobacteraceae bacterium]
MKFAMILLAALFVRIETTAGSIVVQLDSAHAPITAKNFLRYVDAHKYDGASFYRVVRPGNQSPHRPIQVIQGGLDVERFGPYGPIALEPTSRTGLHNSAGTIAIARDKPPNTGSSEFFINMVDDPLLDAQHSPDHFGYAVFGRVVRGMDVARRIHRSHANGQRLAPPIRILRMVRVRI